MTTAPTRYELVDGVLVEMGRQDKAIAYPAFPGFNLTATQILTAGL